MRTFNIVIGPLAQEELDGLRAFDHRAIRDAISLLTHEAVTPGRQRKRLPRPPAELRPELELVFEGPVPDTWQLRVGEFRVIYVVIETTAYVLRIVKKGRRTTGQALS